MDDHNKHLIIETEPATPWLSTIYLPFDNEGVDFLCESWQNGGQPIALILSKEVQEQLYQTLRSWRQGRKHRLLGNTCPVCDRDIDDRAKACKDHRVKSPGRGRRRRSDE